MCVKILTLVFKIDQKMQGSWIPTDFSQFGLFDFLSWTLPMISMEKLWFPNFSFVMILKQTSSNHANR